MGTFHQLGSQGSWMRLSLLVRATKYTEYFVNSLNSLSLANQRSMTRTGLRPGAMALSVLRSSSSAVSNGLMSAASLTLTWHQTGIARPFRTDIANTAMQNEPNWAWSIEQYQ